jgi:hypothetical protein
VRHCPVQQGDEIVVNYDFRSAQQLASDIRSAHQAIDSALADVATLASSVIQTCRTSDAAPAQTQAVIEGVAAGLNKMVDARKGFIEAHREIALAQRDSNLKEVGFGCLGPDKVLQPAGLRVVNG